MRSALADSTPAGSGGAQGLRMRAQPHERDGARESKQLKQLIAAHGAPGLA